MKSYTLVRKALNTELKELNTEVERLETKRNDIKRVFKTLGLEKVKRRKQKRKRTTRKKNAEAKA